jgi:hypothetical protein
MLHHDLRLGAVSPKLAPLYAYWRPHFKLWIIAPLVALTAYIVFLRRTRVATSLSNRSANIAFCAFAILTTVTVALSDGGPRSIIAPLLRTDLEYIGAIDRVHNVAAFLREYPKAAASMPMHARVHPPGPVLFSWASSQIVANSTWGTAAGIVLFSALALPLVYRWADRLCGPGVARRAAALFLWTPSFVLFTTTSMDGPFAVLLIAMNAIYWESMEHRPILLGTVAGIVACFAALMTYSVTVSLLFCGVACCIRFVAAPAMRRNIVFSACSALIAFIAANTLLWILTGYDPVAMFFAAAANHTDIMYGARHETPDRYAHLAVANLVVFFVSAGIPGSILWCSNAGQSLGAARALFGTGEPPNGVEASNRNDLHWHCFVLTSIITLLGAAIVPVFVLEVERIWMFLVPLVVIPAARRMFEQDQGTGRAQATVVMVILVAAQTLITELLLSTYW